MKISSKLELTKEEINSLWYWATIFKENYNEIQKRDDHGVNVFNNIYVTEFTKQLNQLVNNAFNQGREFERKQ